MRHEYRPVTIDLADPARVAEQRRNAVRYRELKDAALPWIIAGYACFALAMLQLRGTDRYAVAEMAALMGVGYALGIVGGRKIRCPNCGERRHNGDQSDTTYESWKSGRCPQCGWFVTEEALQKAMAALPPEAP